MTNDSNYSPNCPAQKPTSVQILETAAKFVSRKENEDIKKAVRFCIYSFGMGLMLGMLGIIPMLIEFFKRFQ